MGVDLVYRLGGRKVSPDQFFEGILGEAVRGAVNDAVSRVERVRCGNHGQGARVSAVHETRDGFRLEITGCCDQLITRAQDAAFS